MVGTAEFEPTPLHPQCSTQNAERMLHVHLQHHNLTLNVKTAHKIKSI
jgi:hypothetical protein